MPSEDVLEFTDGNFESDVVKSDLPVLVDFWAEWCQPCKMLTPTIEELAAEFKGKVKIGKLKRDHDRYLRQLLIHGARSAVYHLGDKQDAESRWLRELVKRRGVNIASVALAHKNARQAWAIMAQQQEAQH